MGKWSTNAHLVVTIRVHAVVMLSVLVGTVHVSTVLTSRKPAKQSCSHEERRHIKLWKHISAYRKGSSRGDEKAPRRKDAESDSAIINNKSSVISAGIISPGTARNKAGERVFQRRFSFLFSPLCLTFKPASASHAAAAIYPSVTPISAKLAPFISKAAVRDTYYAETLSLDTPSRNRSRTGNATTTLFLNAREQPPCRINAQLLQVNRSVGLLGGRVRYPEISASL